MVGVVSFSHIGKESVKISGYFATPEYYQNDDFRKVRFDAQQPQIVVVEFETVQFRLAINGANVDDPLTKTYNPATGATDYTKCLEVLNIGGQSSFASATLLADAITLFFDLPTGSAGYNDASGKLSITNSVILGEYRFVRNITVSNNSLMSSYASGGASGAWNATFNSFRMTTNGAASGIVLLQSRQTHPYFAGQSQEFEFTTLNFDTTGGNTAVIKRIGYYHHYVLTAPVAGDTLDGIYFESTNGIVTFKIVHQGTLIHSAAQSTWIYDKLDGTGPSGITVDWSKFQVFIVNFLYLGGATCNVYLFQNGETYLVHKFWNTNTGTTVFMGNPNQPFTAELIDTVGATAATFDFLCGNISTANQISQFAGTLNAIAKLSNTSQINDNLYYLLVGLRLDKTSVENRNVSVQIRSASIAANTSGAVYQVMLLRNPTTSLGAGSWTNYASSDNKVQYFLANEGSKASTFTFSTETTVHTQIVSGNASFTINAQDLPRLGVPADPSGAWGEIWLGFRGNGGNSSYIGSLSWVISV